jgi:hypothetical protein
VSVNLVQVLPVWSNGNATNHPPNLLIQNVTVYDPTNNGANANGDIFTIGNGVTLSEVIVQKLLTLSQWVTDNRYNNMIFNTVLQDGMNGTVGTAGLGYIFSGIVASKTAVSQIPSGSIGGDVILDAICVIPYFTEPQGIAGSGIYLGGGALNFLVDGQFRGGNNVFYGTGSVAVRGHGALYYTGTAVAAFVQTGAWSFNGTTTGSSYCSGTPGVWTQAITINPTNIDAACSTTGFGGTVWGRGGAVIANNF